MRRREVAIRVTSNIDEPGVREYVTGKVNQWLAERAIRYLLEQRAAESERDEPPELAAAR